MTGVYSALVEDALPAALFNNQPATEQYFIKTKQRIGQLAFVQFVLAIAIVAVGVYFFFAVDRVNFYYYRYDLEFTDSLIIGIVGMICACFGIRVAAQRKGRCIFITYFVLTIISAAFTGISFLLAALRMEWSGSMVKILLSVVLRGSYMIVAVVSSAMICSIWGRIGGYCCCSGSEPSVILMQTTTATDGVNGDTGRVMFVPMRRP